LRRRPLRVTGGPTIDERAARLDPGQVVDRLAVLPELAGVPRRQLEWLVDHGTVLRQEAGFIIRGTDDIRGLIVVIAGSFSVRTREQGAERVMRGIFPGRVTGFLPFSKMTTPRGYLVADEPVEFLLLSQDTFRELTRECYEFTEVCVQEMLARARVFKSADKQQEKLAALGRLSAGLAHELNNPSSAVVRAAIDLDASRTELAAAALVLGAAGLGDGALTALRSVEAAAAERAAREVLGPVDRASLEDECMEWLEMRGADPTLAFALVENGVRVAELDAATATLEPAAFEASARYVAANVAARGLAADVLGAAKRIHALVAAVKRHTHMDRALTEEAIQVGDHVGDAVTLLSSKASLKSVSLDLTVAPGVPRVMGSVADLNQVWLHLIDNAIDAVSDAGHVAIDVAGSRDFVLVRVVDDGPGIPEEDHDRVFEPFFTTKDVSQGRGLGLDIVRTVVDTHRGSVELASRPGRTEFRVTLPAAGPSA
jgi:signal transduction histidine kinase